MSEHPLLTAVRPLLDRIGAQLVPADRAREGDVPLHWEGEQVAAVRLPATGVAGGLDAMIQHVSRELGAPLSELDRPGKQRAVRLLDERGAFEIRKSVDTVAEALGVSRFTVYNYLNRS